MVIDEKIIVENKATEKLCPADRTQLLNYLRATKFEVGILFHFGPVPRFAGADLALESWSANQLADVLARVLKREIVVEPAQPQS